MPVVTVSRFLRLAAVAATGISLALPQLLTSAYAETGPTSAAASPVLRAQDMPGPAGEPTAGPVAAHLTLSVLNAPSRLAAPRSLTELSPLLVTRGAHLGRVIDPLAAHSDSITPLSAKSFQAYSLQVRTDAPVLEIGFRGVGGSYRVWVDDHPTDLVPTAAPTGGGFYRLSVAFEERALRNVRFETDESRFTAFTVASGDTVMAAPAIRRRAIVVGDSFAEATKVSGHFRSFGQTLCAEGGWDDCWVSGSGGTGYLAVGAAGMQRVTFRARIEHDVVQYSPDVVVIAGGRNDASFTPLQEEQEAHLLLQQLRAALPNAVLIVTSLFPASQKEATSVRLTTMSAAVKSGTAGLANYYLDVVGSHAYVTGNGNTASPTGTGNADVYTGPDGVHPTLAGSRALGEALFQRLLAEVPT